MEEPLNLQIAASLLDYIRTKQIQPGDLLPPENVLVEEFQVSRVALREGLSRLKALGIVTSRRGSSYRVSSESVAGMLSTLLHALTRGGICSGAELYELRRLLELGAISEAVIHSTEEDCREIRAALKALEQFTELPDEEAIAQFCKAELRFHQALLKPARCKMLEVVNQALTDLFDYQIQNQKTTLNTEELRRTNQEHRALAEAFELKNAPVAMLLLREHLHYPKSVNQSQASHNF